MNNKVLPGFVVIIFGILLAIGPHTIFPVCDSGMMTMKCHNTAKAELVLGIFTIVVGVLLIFGKRANFKIWLNIAGALLWALAFLFPNSITGVCPNAHMTCRSLALPALNIISIALIVFTTANVFYWWKRSKKGEVRNDTSTDFQ